MNRKDIADQIFEKLLKDKADIQAQLAQSKDGIGHFYVDDLVPHDIAAQIHAAFPAPGSMKMKKSLREYKYIAVQMNQYNPLLEEAIYAFQDPRIVDFIAQVCGIETLHPDENLYAGGISLMGKGQYLNPHLDNSHDKDRNKWRVLNLLYYVTPDWPEQCGGNLELWPQGVEGRQITLHSKFNRLIVMMTHESSWHSVSPISVDANRCCVSNYYFSDTALHENEDFHVTSFRGRPEQKLRDLALQADANLRMGIRKIFSKGIVENPHVYKK